MPDQWYYGQVGGKLGPFSSRQLKELAEIGQILPTDTVWKEGIERGVSAVKVKHLFAAGAAASPTETALPAATLPMPCETPVQGSPAHPIASPAAISAVAPPVGEPEKKTQSSSEIPTSLVKDEGKAPENKPADKPAPPKVIKKKLASAVRGAILISQDGTSVQYRKKCPQCGHEDASKNRMPIRSGTTRVNFFCPKCRKLRQAEIQGSG